MEAQARRVPVKALVLLDGVPWSRTIVSSDRLNTLPLASLHAEPAPCNANGVVLGLQQSIDFQTDDVRLLRAMHDEPENPTDLLCRRVCGGGSAGRQSLYQRLMYLFLRDTFQIPEVGGDTQTYGEALATLEPAGQVNVTPIVPAR